MPAADSQPAPSIDEASRAVHDLAAGADAPNLETFFAMLRVRPRARGGKVRAFSKREASEYAPELFAQTCELMRRAGAADALFLPFRETFARVCAAPFTILAQSGTSAHQAVVLCAYALGNKLLRQLCFSADWPQDVQKTPWREEFGGLVVPRIAERLNAATAWFAERPEFQREIDLSQIAAALSGELIRAKAASESEYAQTLSTCVPADTLWLDYGIVRARLSEAANDGRVRTQKAPAGIAILDALTAEGSPALADTIPVVWLRNIVPQATVKGTSAHLARYLKRRRRTLVKIANKWHVQREDALTEFPRQRRNIAEYGRATE